MSTITHHRARLARAVQRGDDATAEDARRDLRAAKLEQAIRAAVDAAPPLTQEQRAHLGSLLVAGGGQRAAA
ncbi:MULTISPECIES: hypothetical protein [Micromonospora]|uniref:hypothetical protein n=1 Tax=Micromonospora TaxID=1873 RepID=UPI00160EA75A